MTSPAAPPAVPLKTIAREWLRIGVTGFGGPAAHIALLRRLIVERHGWIGAAEFEDAIAACNLLPGPASTQLAIFCARRLAGGRGAIVGGLAFVLPAVILMLALSALFFARGAPAWIRGAGAGAGAAVAAVAVRAGADLLKPSLARAANRGAARLRWFGYLAAGAAGAALIGPYLVLVLLGCGLVELASWHELRRRLTVHAWPLALGAVAAAQIGGLAALAWVAFKVGALSYGGGFVIVPLMQGDAVHTYHWMSSTQFLSAVALGQVTPGPVVATVAAVGYAARGIGGGALAAAVAFAPSFLFVLIGGPHFERLRANAAAVAFLGGAGPAAIGAIIGAAIPLADALHETWQFVVLALAAAALLILRRGTVPTLVLAGVTGAVIVLAGGPT